MVIKDNKDQMIRGGKRERQGRVGNKEYNGAIQTSPILYDNYKIKF